MSEIKDVLSLLTQLLPGFVACWVIYGLSSFAKPTPFERIIQALVYSFLISMALAVCEKLFLNVGIIHQLGIWDKQVEVVLSGVFAIALGLTISYFSQTDTFYSRARQLNLTSRTAYPSEWYGAFKQRQLTVVLHLEGERRVRGYPEQWPDEPGTGCFNLLYPAWLDAENNVIALESVDTLLIPAKQVLMVEFLKPV
jgi:hypothetical protein